MGQSQQTKKIPDGSFDTSGGAFPDGYCVWDGSSIVSTHCAPGFECGGSPPKDSKPRFDGDLQKVACQPTP